MKLKQKYIIKNKRLVVNKLNDISTIKDGLTQLFSNNPIIWGKWLLVFASLILTFVLRLKFKIDDKLDPFKKLEEKVKKAIESKHIINATLVKRYISWDEKNRRTYTGKYEYEIDGKKHNYTAKFGEEHQPPRILHLYYENTSTKVFTNEECHYYAITGLPLVILNFSPFIVGALMVWLLGLAG